MNEKTKMQEWTGCQPNLARAQPSPTRPMPSSSLTRHFGKDHRLVHSEVTNPSPLPAAAMKSLSRFLSPSSISRRLLHSSSGTFTSADGFVSSVSSPGGRDEPKSVAYRRSMLRPPPAVSPWNLRRNACSFIGTVESRVQRSGGLNAFTFLEVKSDPRLPISSAFRVCLWMQDRLAEISLKHLKPNDFIYVSGFLGSYEKLNASGQCEGFYKVAVQDLNYVRRFNQHHPTLKPVTSGELFASPSGAVGEEMAGESDPSPEKQHLNRLHLWQLFFASPNEWWDNRVHKKNTRFPDFKHKDTKECLWLTPDDPPWIRRQLQLYDDSNMEGAFKREAGHLLDSHQWKWESKDL